MQALGSLIPLVVFVGVYLALRRRAAADGTPPGVRWGWLAAMLGCAAAAVLLGALL